jgi:nucleolin
MPKPQTKKVVEESSSEEEEIVTTKKQQKTNTGAAKPAVTKKPAKVESDSSDEEEIIQPAKGKTAQKAAAKKVVKEETSETSSEDEKPAKKAAPVKAAAKVQPKKKVEESSDEDEPVAPPKKTAPVKAAPVKAAAKKVVESDDESSEEEVKPVKKAAPVKAAAKKVVEESDEESSEEEKPAKKAAPVKAAAKKVVEESDEEEEEVAPVKATAKPVVQATQGEDAGKGLNHPHEIIVKGLPFAASEHDLNEYFKECGTVDGVNLLKGPDGRSKGIAFVRFTTEDGVKSAVGFSGSDFGGRSVTIEKTVPRDQRAPAAGAPREFPKTERDPTSASVFVGNLSYQTNEDSLWSFFESCGQVASVRVAKDPEGNPRGFAHVDFASPDSVEAAVQKAGSKLDGRPIRVDYSTPKKTDGQRGGFGGGNRFGGDRQGGFGGGNRGFGGGNRGPPGGNRMNLGEDDNNRKKGAISSFQGSKQRL